MILATLIMVASPTAPATPHGPHVKLFASTMTVARTASEACPGVILDNRLLEALRQKLRSSRRITRHSRRRPTRWWACFDMASQRRRAGRSGSMLSSGCTGSTGRWFGNAAAGALKGGQRS